MGLLKSFFAAMVANEISEKKRIERDRVKAEQEGRDNAIKVLNLWSSFYNYQTQINCSNAQFKHLISDEDIDNNNVSSYDVTRTEQLLNGYKRQLEEFMNYGGDPIYICDYECDSNKMDLYIEIVKRLKEYGWLDKQEEYISYADDTYFLEFDWKNAQMCRSVLDELKDEIDIINAKDSVAYENINSLTGVEFEGVCKRLLENMGFSVETTKTTGDGGIDLIAYNSQPLLSGKYIIQCKRYTGSVGEPIIRDLYGVITSERANKGVLMTSGVFTKQAQMFAEDKPIELIDGVKLQELLKNYYK